MSASRQLPQTSTILTNGQEGVMSEQQKRVYIAYRAVFKGEAALMRQRKAISKVVSNLRKSGQGRVEGLGESDIVDILEVMLKRNLFDLETKAQLALPAQFTTTSAHGGKYSLLKAAAGKSEAKVLKDAAFPDVSTAILAKDAQHNLSKAEAVTSEAKFREANAFPNLSTTTLAQDAHHSLLHADAVKSEAKVLEDIVLLKIDQDRIHAEDSDDGVSQLQIKPTPSPIHIDGIQVPSLYPLYIPYKAQHQVLSRTQRLLEERCYAFTEQWLPELLEQRQWDCPEAIELNTWTYVVAKRLNKLPSHCFGDLGSEPSISLAEVLISINNLRHAAVHRVRTTANGISEMIRLAIRFVCVLGGSTWGKQLEELRRVLDGEIRAMELNKNFLETKLGREMQDIARQRKELDEKEKRALTTMLKEDKDYCLSVGDLLSRSAEQIFAGNTDDGLNLTVAEQDLAPETAEEETSLIVDPELPPQARLASAPERDPHTPQDTSHDEHQPRSDSTVLLDADPDFPTLSDTPGETHHGYKATESQTLDAIGKTNAIPQDSRSASFCTGSGAREPGDCLDPETYMALSRAVDAEIDSYDSQSMCTQPSDKPLQEIHDSAKPGTKTNISADQLNDFVCTRIATSQAEKRLQVNIDSTTKDKSEGQAAKNGYFYSEDEDEDYEPGRCIATYYPPPHTPDETSGAVPPFPHDPSSCSSLFGPLSSFSY